MSVAVKVVLFQNTPATAPLGTGPRLPRVCNQQQVLLEAAVCCSVAHPNVVATYHYEVLQATFFQKAPSGICISDQSGSGAYKLYLIQVCQQWWYFGVFRMYLKVRRRYRSL